MFSALADELKDEFPIKEHRRDFEAKIEIKDGKLVSKRVDSSAFGGVRVANVDHTVYVQFRPDGFTLNNRKTYMGGDQLIDKALMLWEMLIERATPKLVSRVALRSPWPMCLPEDRSLGTEAEDLRESLEEATAPASAERASEIVSCLLGAVERAEGSDGVTVSFSTFGKTLEFMMSLPAELPLPVVVVETEDEIGLDWDEDHRRVVSLTVYDSDEIGFSALFGREPLYGRVERVDGLPETLRYILARLYPSAELG